MVVAPRANLLHDPRHPPAAGDGILRHAFGLGVEIGLALGGGHTGVDRGPRLHCPHCIRNHDMSRGVHVGAVDLAGPEAVPRPEVSDATRPGLAL